LYDFVQEKHVFFDENIKTIVFLPVSIKRTVVVICEGFFPKKKLFLMPLIKKKHAK